MNELCLETAEYDLDRLPVVDSPDRRQLVGLFSRDDIFKARVIWFKEESVKERYPSVGSWLKGLAKHGSARDDET